MKRLTHFLFILFILGLFSPIHATPMKGPGEFKMKHPDICKRFPATTWAIPEQRCVKILAEACGLHIGYEIEYLLAGHLSDRSYESLAIAWANPSDVAKAFKQLNISPGIPANVNKSMPIARGERFTVTIEAVDGTIPPLNQLLTINDPRMKDLLIKGFPWVGDKAIDDTMPAAILACYTERYSAFGLPFWAEKGSVYGSWRIAYEIPLGTPLIFTFTHVPTIDGTPRVVHKTLQVTPETLAAPTDFLKELKDICSDERDIFLTLAPSPSLTVGQMRGIANIVLAAEKQGGFTIDAPSSGSVAIKAFQPNPTWLKREDRLYQPWEVSITQTPNGYNYTLTQIEEDWSGEGIDPKLTPKSYPFKQWQELMPLIHSLDTQDGKMNTLFFIVPSTLPLRELSLGIKSVEEELPILWIFTHETN